MENEGKKWRFYNILFDGMYCSVKEWLKQTVFLTCAVVCFRRYLQPVGSPKKEKKGKKKREITYIPGARS